VKTHNLSCEFQDARARVGDTRSSLRKNFPKAPLAVRSEKFTEVNGAPRPRGGYDSPSYLVERATLFPFGKIFRTVLHQATLSSALPFEPSGNFPEGSVYWLVPAPAWGPYPFVKHGAPRPRGGYHIVAI